MADEIPMFMDAPEGASGGPGVAPAGAPMSDAQVMADALVQYGKWTKEEAAAHLATPEGEDTGFDPRAPAPAKAPPPEGVDEISAMAFAAPKAISEYRFETPQGAEANQEQALAVKQLFFAEGIPPSLGNAVARLYDQATVSPPSDAQRQSMGVQTMAALEKQYGADAPRCIAAARGEVARLAARNPNITAMLDESGLGSNLFVINSLISIARARGRLR
jgi:hypothetical protein